MARERGSWRSDTDLIRSQQRPNRRAVALLLLSECEHECEVRPLTNQRVERDTVPMAPHGTHLGKYEREIRLHNLSLQYVPLLVYFLLVVGFLEGHERLVSQDSTAHLSNVRVRNEVQSGNEPRLDRLPAALRAGAWRPPSPRALCEAFRRRQQRPMPQHT